MPPADANAFGVGLEIGPPRDQIEVRHVRTVAVEQNDLFEAVVGQRFADVEHAVLKMLEVVVDRAGKIHDMSGVAVRHDRQHFHLVGNLFARSSGNAARADKVHVERQVRAVLFDGAAGDDANLSGVDSVFDFGPSQLFIAIVRQGAIAHGKNPLRAGDPSSWPLGGKRRLGSMCGLGYHEYLSN